MISSFSSAVVTYSVLTLLEGGTKERSMLTNEVEGIFESWGVSELRGSALRLDPQASIEIGTSGDWSGSSERRRCVGGVLPSGFTTFSSSFEFYN